MEGIKTQERFYIICDFSTNYPLHSYKQLWLEEVNLFSSSFFFFLMDVRQLDEQIHNLGKTCERG